MPADKCVRLCRQMSRSIYKGDIINECMLNHLHYSLFMLSSLSGNSSIKGIAVYSCASRALSTQRQSATDATTTRTINDDGDGDDDGGNDSLCGGSQRKNGTTTCGRNVHTICRNVHCHGHLYLSVQSTLESAVYFVESGQSMHTLLHSRVNTCVVEVFQ